MTIAGATYWDDCPGAVTPRGWYVVEGTYAGFYLDYGAGNYRTGDHDQEHTRFCGGRNTGCRTCEPGDILAVAYPGGPGTREESRYVETIAQAKAWIEGAVAAVAQ